MDRPLMHGAVADLTQAIGHTPIVRLNRIAEHVESSIYVKLEYLNPAGSMKDRVALNIIGDAERRGMLGPGGTIVEATSGNTGAGLAMVAATRGYKCIFVMPDKMSKEKIDALRAYGAKVVICPTAVEPSDPRSYYSVARRIVEETPGRVLRQPVPQPRQPRGALPLDRAGDLGADRRRVRRVLSPAWAPAARCRAAGATSRRRTPT